MIYNIEQIIHKVYAIPQLKKLSNYRCFDFIYEHLEEVLVKNIREVYFKNGYIYFQVSHPAIKMALQYELESQIHHLLESNKTCEYMKNNFKGVNVKIDSNN
jgi:hypothetical protein